MLAYSVGSLLFEHVQECVGNHNTVHYSLLFEIKHVENPLRTSSASSKYFQFPEDNIREHREVVSADV